MNMQSIERQFKRIGARAKVHPPVVRRRGTTLQEKVSIDIGNDAEGEFFDIAVQPVQLTETRVIDIQPSLRHLLLMSRQDDGKHKFLCGHDERHWFVAAVPERKSVSSVKTAFDALKPTAVRALENRLGVKSRKRNRRRNEAFVRQGEWFFVPVENPGVLDERLALRNEPIARGGGKPHMCEELVRLRHRSGQVNHEGRCDGERGSSKIVQGLQTKIRCAHIEGHYPRNACRNPPPIQLAR